MKKRNEQSEVTEILDESGVTPAHFAAQGEHLDCRQVSGRMCEWVCAVSVISACSSLKRVYRIATVATITAIMFLDI